LFIYYLAVNTESIVAELDAEISRLQQAKTILTGIGSPAVPAVVPAKRGPGRPPKAAQAPARAPVKRTMSAEGRARIAAATKARWAKAKKTAKPAK